MRAYKPPTGHLDRKSASYHPSHEASFVYGWMKELSDIEPLAMSLVRPFNPFAIKPILRKVVTTQDRAIFNYFRVILSSADQNQSVQAMGRGAQWMLFDGESGCFLGLWAMTGTPTPWGFFSDWAGGKVGISGADKNGSNTSEMVQSIIRCIPLAEFGLLTGGKLLTLLATSSEVLRVYELQFSIMIMAVVIKTLHGKAAQYNRLHARGLEDCGLAPDGAGVYILQTHKNSKAVLTGASKDPGKKLTHGLAQQTDYWKDRWLVNRRDLLEDGMCRPDPMNYRLSDVLHAKIEQRVLHTRDEDEGTTDAP